jgi:hypothetical protein
MTYPTCPRANHYPATLPGILALLTLSAGAHAQDADVTDVPVSIASQSVQSASSRARRPSFEYKSVWGGPSYNCGITRDAEVECWGATGTFPGVKPQFGPHPTPQVVLGVSHAESIGAGVFGACAVLSDHSGLCWGGIGAADGALVEFPLSDLKSVVPNGTTVCALLRNGKVFCSLGGDRIDSFRQVKFERKVKSLAAGNGYVFCATTDGDRVSCFSTMPGQYSSGALGNDGSDEAFEPKEVREVRGAKRVTVGDAHACALVGSDVYCWGSNSTGELGFESADPLIPVPTPTQVKGLGSVQAIGAGLAHSCALAKNGNVFCWGDAYGFTPVQIDDLPKADGLSSGADADCIVAREGGTYCFGNNDNGQLGSPEPFDDNGLADFFPPERVGS